MPREYVWCLNYLSKPLSPAYSSNVIYRINIWNSSQWPHIICTLENTKESYSYRLYYILCNKPWGCVVHSLHGPTSLSLLAWWSKKNPSMQSPARSCFLPCSLCCLPHCLELGVSSSIIRRRGKYTLNACTKTCQNPTSPEYFSHK